MADIARKAAAHWQGDLKSGKGTVSLESGLLKDAQYGFQSRFENGPGTNPEELLASALAERGISSLRLDDRGVGGPTHIRCDLDRAHPQRRADLGQRA